MTKYFGKYKGFVHSNNDPENRGRLQVIVPQIYSEPFKKWALPSGMFTGAGIGSFFIPNEKDPVWVEFEGGDVRFPIWTYGWLRDADNPDGSPDVKVLQTTSGNRIELNDTEKSIAITDPHDNKVLLNSFGVSIIAAKKISLGAKEGSKENALLGDTVKKKLESLIDAILRITLPTPAGPTVPNGVINAAEFISLKESLTEILSTKVTLD